MKTTYIKPEMEVIILEMEEVIAQSGGGGSATVGGEDYDGQGFSRKRDLWGND